MPRFVLPLLAILLAVPPAPLLAQGRATLICGQRDQIVAQLRTRFGEELRATGLAGPTRIVELFASDATGSWTITVTSVDGTTCLMASGQNYQATAPQPPGEPT
jgi:hypothetical protein